VGELPNLRIGDVRNLGVKDFEDTIVLIGDAWISWQDSENGVILGEPGDPINVHSELRYRYENRVKSGTLHRRTQAGLVRIWPKVEG
jgi:hypothetical protein